MTINEIATTSSNLASPPTSNIAMSALELDGYLTGIVATPRATPISPERWMAYLWGDDEPTFNNDAQIKRVLGPVINHYNVLVGEIDRSLNRLEADKIADYRPRFLSGNQKPTHDDLRSWVRGFWKAMSLDAATWTALAEDERTQIIIEPFVAFVDVGELQPDEIPANIDDLLDQKAALIPRMILILRKLARLRQAKAAASRRPRQTKVGRNDPCPCGSGQKYKRCCARS